ncbi:MAG: hypothetical protein COA68_12365 [Oceanobacter sp.]|nr:MAG: hypothetical protein COA68_12365 [Oceanobacter sp.]
MAQTQTNAKTELIEKSITTRTLQQYTNRVDIVKKFMANRGVETCDASTFAEFLKELSATTGTHKKTTAEGYRSAISFFQHTYGIWMEQGTIWADGWEARRIVAGYGYDAKAAPQTEGKNPRGQIDQEMFNNMMIIATEKYKRFAGALEIGYRVALRPHQLVDLHKGSFKNGKLLVPDKRATSKNGLPITTWKEVVDPEARFILQALEENRTGKYFDFSARDIGEIVKAISKELQWEETLGVSFDGAHCLRHGGMSHIDKIYTENGYDTIQKLQKMQVVETTHTRYTRANAKRQRQ